MNEFDTRPAPSNLPSHFVGLTEKERRFAELRAQGIPMSEACEEAGYAYATAGYKVQRKPHVARAIEIEGQLVRNSEAPRLWRQLMEKTESDNEKVALDAIKSGLDRVGVVPGRKLEVNHTSALDELSVVELKTRLASLVAGLSPELRASIQGGALTALPVPDEGAQPENGDASAEPLDVDYTTVETGIEDFGQHPSANDGDCQTANSSDAEAVREMLAAVAAELEAEDAG